MPTLEELKEKWFLDFSASGASFPPVKRHKGSTVSNCTDGNNVIPLIDGQEYMGAWHDLIESLAASNESVRDIYHASFTFDLVRTLGNTKPASNALDVLKRANNAGVAIYPLLCANKMGTGLFSLTSMKLNGIMNASLDLRFGTAGANHQKLTCLKTGTSAKVLMGSMDIISGRWDTKEHLPVSSERHPDAAEKPTHDLGVLIEGPAVADFEKTFIDRWNDSSRTLGMVTLGPTGIDWKWPIPIISTPVSAPQPAGTHSIQVLRTYGMFGRLLHYNYSWGDEGEFTVWASYLNAIKKATKYIYIEDQYFQPFGWPPCYTRTSPDGNVTREMETDLFYQLSQAIKRGVKVIVVLPENSEDLISENGRYSLNTGVNFLAETALYSSTGSFAAISLRNGSTPIFVHSKLMICDDEFVILGSANFNQRGMAHDSEIDIAVVDSQNIFAKDLRKELWAEHLNEAPDLLDDFDTAFSTFVNHATSGIGRVRFYPARDLETSPIGHETMMNNFVDPYAGPPRE